jgi:2-phospho-L-lactate/phosphoenolpyruvate guanylyltransferase
LKPLAVLIPVKSSGPKSRLSEVLSLKERQELGALLLGGVLKALRQAGLLGVSHVISSDKSVLEYATGHGARAIPEPRDAGVNSAVIRGIKGAGFPDSVLVLPSDLPFIRGAEIRHLLTLKSLGFDAVLVPSSAFDGTNALLFAPSSGLTLSYDDNSFWNHLKAGARKGLSVGVSSGRRLMFDVDSAEDLRALARSRADTPLAAFAGRAGR